VRCPRRESSTHAPQALELLNGGFSNQQAKVLAARMQPKAGIRLASRSSWLTGWPPAAANRARIAIGARFSWQRNPSHRRREGPRRICARSFQLECVLIRELTCPNTPASLKTGANFFATHAAASVGLAFAQMLMYMRCARAATLKSLAPKAPDMPDKAKAKSVIFSVYGRRAQPYRDLRSQASAQPAQWPEAAAEFGEAKYQLSRVTRGCLAPSARSAATERSGHRSIRPAAAHRRLRR